MSDKNVNKEPDGMPQPDPYNQNIEKSAVVNINNYNLYESLPRDESTESDLKNNRRKDSVPKPRGEFRCRDVPFLVLFIVFWVGMAVISLHTFVTAPYDTLLYGRNSYKNLCGSENYEDYKYVAYVLSTEQMIRAENPVKYKVCANVCPGDYLLYSKDLYIEENNQTVYYLANLDFRNETYQENYLSVVNFKNLTNYYEINEKVKKLSEYDNLFVPSVSVFNRCIPDLEIFGLGSWSEGLQGGVDFSTRVYQSVLDSIDIILMVAGISLGLTFIWLIFTYFFTGIFIWCSVILSIVASGAVTVFSWYIYTQSDDEEAIRSSILNTNNPYVNKYLYNKKAFLIISIILSILFVIEVLFFIFARKRISFGIKIVKEAGKAVMKYPFLSLIPLIQFILIIILTVFFSLIFIPVTITSREEISTKTRETIAKHTPLKEDNISVKSYGLIIELYVVLGYYWTYYFIKALGKTTICGTIATWYWAPKKDNGRRKYQSNAIIKTFIRIVYYNLGSLALGSLILGIISVIKYILAKIQHLAEKNKESEFVKCCIRCTRCCVGCIDKIVKFITKNAYVEIAIYGYSFCKSSIKAGKLIIRNAFRVIVVGKIGDLIFTLGKVLVVATTMFLTFLILKNKNIQDTYLLSIPLIIAFFLSLTIISIFMTVLNSAIDTIFISVCEDLERNDGSPERPYYMRKRLRRLLVKDNKSEKEKVKNMY
ncbi:DUF580-domain-containing protein [Neocallimastix sp. 'constans']|jgi:hypothetical protein